MVLLETIELHLHTVTRGLAGGNHHRKFFGSLISGEARHETHEES